MFGNDLLIDTWSKPYEDKEPLSTSEDLVRRRLQDHVWRLASEIGERNHSRPEALELAAQYVEQSFGESGLSVRLQQFIATDGHRARNIEATLQGSASLDTLVLGAHYDTIDCPGANDNASGVAALLEIASAISQRSEKPRHTIRLVAFANEEPPYFGSKDMGSRVYAQELRRKNENVLGMICLETLGYYSTDKASQQIPSPLNLIYRNDVGNFVLFCGNSESAVFMKRLLYAFREHCQFPSEGLAVPLDVIPDIALSDNQSFWDEGFKAIMITDTVYLRYKHYHQLTDTADKLNYDAFAKVAAGLSAAVWSVSASK